MMAPDVCRLRGCIAAWVEVPTPPMPEHVRAACRVVGIAPPAEMITTGVCARCFDALPEADQAVLTAVVQAEAMLAFNAELWDRVRASCECDDCRREREAGAA